MFRNSRAIITMAVALCATLTSPLLLQANNLFVLPTFSGNATGTANIYSGNPLTSVGTFTTAADAYLVLAKPAINAADTKYYVISRSGSNSLVILNNNFAPSGNPISLGQNVTAAALTPDGNRLLVVAGNLRIYNTANDTEIQTQFLDVGLNPNDIAISQDSTRAYVMSAQGQKITGIDLTTNLRLENIPLPGITQGFAAVGPNGMLYVSSENRVLEVDPRATPFDSSAVRRQFTFPNAKIGRLYFTPDGTRALAVNSAIQSGQALVYFNLDATNPQTAEVKSADALAGQVFEKIFIAGNDRAYVVTAGTSFPARKIYEAQLPVAGGTTTLQPPVLTEPLFGSLGNIPIVDSIAFTSEYPRANRMYVGAPLNLLQAGATNTIYNVNLQSSPANVTGTLSLNFLPGPLQFAGPAQTTAQESPNGVITLNATQPSVAASGRTLPFGVKVISSTGRPLFGVPVAFTPATAGVQIVGNLTVNTNADGIAMISAVAPAASGQFGVTASVGSSGLATTFSFLAGGSSSGGGTGSGGTGSGRLVVVEGDGQVIREGNLSQPIKIRLEDAAGKPVVGANVTWAVTQGLGIFRDGTFQSDGRYGTLTDSKGESTNTFGAPVVEIGKSFTQNVLSVSAGDQSATLYATAVVASNSGGPVSPGTFEFAKPDEGRGIRGKAGETLPGAIVVSIRTASLPELGQPIPNVGLSVRVESVQTPAPAAECSPKPIALSDEQGTVTCDLKLTGRAGTGTLVVNVGGIGSERRFPITVDPGEPSVLKILNGNNQSGEANQNLPAQLVVELGDGGGNPLGSATIRWEIIQGQATLANSTTVTDNNGRALNNVRLGSTPGTVLIRATALGGKQPTITFEANIKVTVSGLALVSGNGQTTFTNTGFAQPLVVAVTDAQQRPVPNVPVNFAVTSGTATLSATTASTDSNGRATVTARAGTNPGAIVITASTQGVQTPVTFNLTAQLPGPIVNPLDFYNGASNERGAVVPGGVYRMVGTGLATDLRGCTSGAANVFGQLPTRVAGVEVQFGTTLAPIFSVCNENGREEVTLQVPFEVTPGFPVNVTARVGSGSSVIPNVVVKDYQPGVFETVDGQNRRYALAIRPNGSFVTPDNPARYNEIIRVYITGAGQVSPTATTGATGAGNQKLTVDVVVGVNNQGVRVVSSEYLRGFVGLYEIQFEVPQGTQTGAAQPLGVLLVRPDGQFIFPDNSPTIAIAP